MSKNGGFTWVTFYPDDFLVKVAPLSMSEQGAFINILSRIYKGEGFIEYDIEELSFHLRAPECELKEIVEKLIHHKYLYVDGSFLRSKRADEELSERAERSKKARDSVAKRYKKKKEDSATIVSDSNTTASEENTTVDGDTKEPTTVYDSNTTVYDGILRQDKTRQDNIKNKNTNVFLQKKENDPKVEKRKPKRGTRLPKDWTLPKEWRDYAIENGINAHVVEREEVRFKNYWLSDDAKNPAKKDWFTTWKMWILKYKGEFVRGVSPPARSPRADDMELLQELMSKQNQEGKELGSYDILG